MEIRMELREVQIVNDLQRPQVILLGEVDGPRAFPIFIGHFEASQLDLALHKYPTPRPMTHDLVINCLEGLEGQLDRVVIDDLRALEGDIGGQTFFGKLAVHLADGEERLIDCRPSDAIVIATKQGVPIYAEAHVLEEASPPPNPEQ